MKKEIKEGLNEANELLDKVYEIISLLKDEVDEDDDETYDALENIELDIIEVQDNIRYLE